LGDASGAGDSRGEVDAGGGGQIDDLEGVGIRPAIGGFQGGDAVDDDPVKARVAPDVVIAGSVGITVTVY